MRKHGSRLQGHPDMRRVPGIEISTGSLGQGLSIANGMALALRLDGSASRVYILLGDGEMQEGQVWEAAMSAAHYRLDNVCAILDYNKQQIDGYIKDIKGIEPIAGKWASFGWNVIEIDGHDFAKIIGALKKASETKNIPTIIIAHTVKGRGVTFMEDKLEFHGRAPNKDEFERALGELM